MNKPTNSVNEFYALNPSQFGYLEKLELSQKVQPEEWFGFTLVLQLRPSGEAESPCLHLEFSQAQELRLGPLEGLLFYNVEIQDITDRQLEDRRYFVVETEQDIFSFYCRSFSATLERN